MAPEINIVTITGLNPKFVFLTDYLTEWRFSEYRFPKTVLPNVQFSEFHFFNWMISQISI